MNNKRLQHTLIGAIQAYLKDPALRSKFSPEVIQAVESGQFNKLKLHPFIAYERFNGGQVLSNIKELFDQATKIADGISSIESRKVPQDTVFTGIRFQMKSGATATSPAAIAYSDFEADVPVEIRNADIVFDYNESSQLRLPVKELLMKNTVKDRQNSEYSYDFPAPLIVKKEKTIVPTLKMANGVSTDAGAGNAYFIETSLVGIAVSIRG